MMLAAGRVLRRSAPSLRRSLNPARPSPVSALNRGVASFSSERAARAPSFAIAAAFEGHEELENDENEGSKRGGGAKKSKKQHIKRQEEGSEEDEAQRKARELKEQFRAGMDKKKRWMAALGERGDFPALVKAVSDCYAPLYEQLRAADAQQWTENPLEKLFGEEVETKFTPRRFDDMLTKLTEQEALALLVTARQSELASAVIEHRLQLQEQLSTHSPVTIQGDSVLEDRQLELTAPLRSFFSWAVGAYSFTKEYGKLMDMYDRAIAAEVYPTSNMNASFLGALVALKRYDDAIAFYEEVAKDSRPVSVFFYRQLLYAVSVKYDAALAGRVVDDMKRKGFKLRAEDYLNAMRAFDREYYVVRRSNEADSDFLPLADRYTTCMERNSEREDNPDAFHEIDESAHTMLELFYDMVERAQITPKNGAIYSRAITAAVLIEDFDRALELLEMCSECADKKTPLHATGVRMAVNALLVLDRPEEAWALVKRMFLHTNPKMCGANFVNIMDYLCIHDRVTDILDMLQQVRALKVQDSLLSNTIVKSIIATLCRNTSSVDDEGVWAALTAPNSGFNVLTSGFWFTYFIEHSSRNGRTELVIRAIDNCNKKKVGGIKPRLALHLMTQFESRSELQNVSKVFGAMDKRSPNNSKGDGDKNSETRAQVKQLLERVQKELNSGL